ncbi:MAG: hypothetical protein H8D23_26580 [Candidatus Brocadiales bacterium]|nr:hypothetical protein [Candidatus Brocadiales bacterium]
MGETEIIKMLNLALEDFSVQTRMLNDVAEITTVEDQRYYEFTDSDDIADSDTVLEVFKVEYDTADGYGKKIPRLSDVPTEGEYNEPAA